ncbi:MAG: glycosyltransferase family 39 protein [Chloroflexota bacterium]|nr:glycosyltransferase family 39 protein [Dehalococcoidia bacterium]MDW8254136.1 glycosyltransferase family 39 protein [Chloroflexota bacterium]
MRLHEVAPPRSLATAPRGQSPAPSFRLPDLSLFGALFVAAALRLVALGSAPLAPAEAATWAAASEGIPALASGSSLSVFAAAGFAAVAGLSELSLRWLSAAAGVVVVALCAPVARRLGGPALARWAVWLAATSPYLIFYDRTATPLALTTLLAMLAIWFYLFLPTGRARYVVGFTGAMLLLSWTSWAFAVVALAQGAFLWVRRPSRRAWRLWLGGAALAALGAVLWWRAPAFVLAPDQSSDLAAEAAALAYKLIAPMAAFALGETLAAGQPVGLAGLVLVSWLAVVGLRRLSKSGRQFVLIFWLLPVLWTAAVTALVLPRAEAPSISAVVGYAWPPFGLTLAAGMVALSASVRRLAYTGLVAIAAFSLGSYFHARTIAQPDFFLPLDPALRFIEARAEEGDVILAEPETMMARHAARLTAPLAVIDCADEAAREALFAERPPPRLWHVDAPTGGGRPWQARLDAWLAAQYWAVETRRYAEPDPVMAALKTRLLGLSPEAGLVLTLYQRR